MNSEDYVEISRRRVKISKYLALIDDVLNRVYNGISLRDDLDLLVTSTEGIEEEAKALSAVTENFKW